MSKNPTQYSPEKLKNFETLIDGKLKTIKKELEKFQSDQKKQKKQLADSNVDFNQSSKHFQQQAKNKQLIRRLQRQSRELRAALKRIEDKTYGICDRTGKLIREERLIAMPIARFDIPSR